MSSIHKPSKKFQMILAGMPSVPSLKDKPDVSRVLQMTKIILEAGGENVKISTSNRNPPPGRHFEHISEKPVPGTEPKKSETGSFSGRDYDELFCEGPETPFEINFDKHREIFEFVHRDFFTDKPDEPVGLHVHPGAVVKVTKGNFEKRKKIAELLNKKFCSVIFREVDSDDYPYFYAADPIKDEFGEMMRRASMLMIDENKFSSQILLIAMGSSTAFVGLFDDVRDLILSIQNIESAKQEKISVIYRDEDHEEGLYGTKIVMSASQMLALAKVKATSE